MIVNCQKEHSDCYRDVLKAYLPLNSSKLAFFLGI